MLRRLAPVLVRRRRAVLVVALVALVFAGAYGGGVIENLSGGGFSDPNAESTKAEDLLAERFGAGDPNLVLVATATGGSVDDPAAVEAGLELTRRLAREPGVVETASYWSLGNAPPLRNADGTRALVFVRTTGEDEDALHDRAVELAEAYVAEAAGPLQLQAGGESLVFDQVGSTIESDLRRAEAIALPITLVLLVLVFGSVVAASLPLGVGIMAIIGTFAVLQGLTEVTEVSIFSINLATALGLGLAIDYSLFVVSRFREELAHGHGTAAAVVRTVRTAGRAVLFSAATVAISLAALLVFPTPFLRSFAYAGIAVAVLAAVGAVVVLPAMLAVLGPRVDALAVGRRRTRPVEPGTGVWHRIATTVMRRPLSIATAVVAFLVLLGLPFLGIDFGLPDDRVLPAGNDVRAVQDVIREEFGSRESAALAVVADGIGDPAARSAEIDAYAAALSGVDGVARVDALTGTYVDGVRVADSSPVAARFQAPDATWLSVVPDVEPVSPAGERMARDVRDVPAPFEVQVAGPSAELVDAKHSVFSRVPLAGAIIAAVTFTVLFLMFGSLLVPFKAVILNLLSLTATFGAMVWIFQEGRFTGVLDFTATGTTDTTTPILMFCIAFGLSMDYEVFLLSRIKEEHDHGASTVGSVASGLERTGRILTAAAVLIGVVFVAFATSGVTFIKLFGLGMALAVLMDAFLIRATLVPAFMAVAGDANWWAPGPLRRLQARIDLGEHALDDDAAAVQAEPVGVGASGTGAR